MRYYVGFSQIGSQINLIMPEVSDVSKFDNPCRHYSDRTDSQKCVKKDGTTDFQLYIVQELPRNNNKHPIVQEAINPHDYDLILLNNNFLMPHDSSLQFGMCAS